MFGGRKASLVEAFFRKGSQPDLGERTAEAFRDCYLELKSLDLPVNIIFMHLQNYAGMTGEPKQQGAALAILPRFFDSCDIFSRILGLGRTSGMVGVGAGNAKLQFRDLKRVVGV